MPEAIVAGTRPPRAIRPRRRAAIGQHGPTARRSSARSGRSPERPACGRYPAPSTRPSRILAACQFVPVHVSARPLPKATFGASCEARLSFPPAARSGLKPSPPSGGSMARVGRIRPVACQHIQHTQHTKDAVEPVFPGGVAAETVCRGLLKSDVRQDFQCCHRAGELVGWSAARPVVPADGCSNSAVCRCGAVPRQDRSRQSPPSPERAAPGMCRRTATGCYIAAAGKAG